MSKPHYYDLVFDVTRMIPEGRVTNYGAIANYLHLGSSRMVGWALNNCIKGDEVPAHRVVNRKGELSGRHHFSPPSAMQEALEREGIKVENDAIVNFDAYFWNPTELDTL
jgi:methylated-DNA-protein-cysteine methyltransferase-like protein